MDTTETPMTETQALLNELSNPLKALPIYDKERAHFYTDTDGEGEELSVYLDNPRSMLENQFTFDITLGELTVTFTEYDYSVRGENRDPSEREISKFQMPISAPTLVGAVHYEVQRRIDLWMLETVKAIRVQSELCNSIIQANKQPEPNLMHNWMEKQVKEWQNNNIFSSHPDDDKWPTVSSDEIVDAGVEAGIIGSTDAPDWYAKLVCQPEGSKYIFEQLDHESFVICEREAEGE